MSAPPSPGPSDSLYRLAFEGANDPLYLLDLTTGRFLDANAALAELTGYERAELLAVGFTASGLLALESSVMAAPRGGVPPERERLEIKLVCKDGRRLPAELCTRRLVREVAGVRQTLQIGSLRDLTAHKRSQRDLWSRIEEQGKATTRLFALTEKLKRVPELAPRLLNATDERELLTQAAELLCSRDGLAYGRVRFFLERDGELRPVGPEESLTGVRKLSLDSPHRVARIFRGEQQPVVTIAEAVLPLMGREAALGVIEVGFDPKEIDALKGNERAQAGYFDVLGTMANTLGLLLENLRLSEALRHQALTDTLTGVFNRRHFTERLGEEVQRCARYGRILSMLMIDVDHFKEINDTLGHGEGDRVLVAMARLLKTLTREVDAVCRFGGDEFAVLMPETPAADAAAKAEALRKAVVEMEFPSSGEGALRRSRPTISVGVAGWRAGQSGEQILHDADQALYESKRLGRNRVSLWSPSAEGGAAAG